MPLYVADWAIDTAGMSRAAKGAIIDARCAMHRNGGPISEKRFQKLVKGLRKNDLQDVRGYFQTDGEFIWSEPQELERRKMEQHRETKRKNANARWDKRGKTGDATAMRPHSDRNAKRMPSSSSSSSRREDEDEEGNKDGNHDKKKDAEKMQIKEFTKRNPEATHTDHLGSDIGQQTNGDSPPDKPEINVSMDDRPEGVRKFLENIKAPKRAAPIIGTWGEHDPHPTI